MTTANKSTGLLRKTYTKRDTTGSLIWCGIKEGFLSVKEMNQRTQDGIEAYAKMQPLRYRTAMAARDQRVARIYCRTPLWSIAASDQ